MNTQDLLELIKTYGKFTWLKNLEVNFIGIDHMSQGYKIFRDLFKKIPHLEILRFHVQSSQVKPPTSRGELKAREEKPKVHSLKSLDFKFSFNTSWYSEVS